MPRDFVFDGVKCKSTEGVLQSFSFTDPEEQKVICQLTDFRAMRIGHELADHRWYETQTLWWQGVEYDRHGPEYRALLERMYTTLYTTNEDAKKALIATGDLPIKHTIGWNNPRETILTRTEFCDILMQIRLSFQTEQFFEF